MPGWTTGDSFYNNLAYTPAIWIALHRICERHGVGDTSAFTTIRRTPS